MYTRLASFAFRGGRSVPVRRSSFTEPISTLQHYDLLICTMRCIIIIIIN